MTTITITIDRLITPLLQTTPRALCSSIPRYLVRGPRHRPCWPLTEARPVTLASALPWLETFCMWAPRLQEVSFTHNTCTKKERKLCYFLSVCLFVCILEVQNGEVYVFSDPSGTGSGWTEQAILFPTSNISTAAFGYSVSAISSTLAVGAKGDGSDNAGRVYVFNTPSNEFLTLLAPPNGDPGDLFGVSVDIQEDLLAVGASAKGNNVNGVIVNVWNFGIFFLLICLLLLLLLSLLLL